MKLPLERWLDDTEPPAEAKTALDEAVRCYKAGAYRAALVFSYLGWGLWLRHRILTANLPTGMPAGKWNTIHADLRNEDKWDALTFDCTQMKTPAPVFVVSEDLRLQVKYWKDRRNDCAHFKYNEIGSAYVEAIWQFIISNIPRFVPNGSKDDVLDRIERHFDPNFTPPGSNIEPIVKLIPSGVDTTELAGFLQSVVGRLSPTVGGKAIPSIADITTVVESMFALGDARLTSELIRFLTSRPELMVAAIRRNPSRVLNWTGDPVTIRRIWREFLFGSGLNDLPVYAAILRNKLIPSDQLQEANEWVISHLSNAIPDPSDLQALTEGEFIEQLRSHCFIDRMVDDFDWANKNDGVIAWLVKTFPITDEIAKVLCSTFDKGYHPFDARNSLKAMFATDPTKASEFKARAQSLSLTPPSSLI